MPRDGAGGFSRVHDFTEDAGNGIDIEADRFDEELDDMAQAIGDSLAANGEKTPTANLPMGGFKHTGVANASARDHYLAAGQAQDGAAVYATVAGTANAIELTLSPAITAYAAGQRFIFKATADNSAAVTVAASGLAAKALQKRGAALIPGDIKNGHVVEIVYDGTQFQMLSPAVGAWEFIGSLTASASAALDFEQASIGDGTYVAVMLVLSRMRPATDGAVPWLRFKKNGAYDAGSGYASWVGGGVSSGASYATPGVGSNKVLLSFTGVGFEDGQEPLSGVVFVNAPGVAKAHFVHFQLTHGNTGGSTVAAAGSGLQNQGFVIQGIRFLFDSGNITSGSAYLFGLRAS